MPGRTYSPETENALRVLSTSDPDKVQFLRKRGIPIHILTRFQAPAGRHVQALPFAPGSNQLE